ncbi:putative glutamine amidotransferase [Anaerosphaera aminiphila DSM 21120]|uniref:Putative glutamine amidotransferase n=1 Tax=Anaerosphaera aminiphila DSM 21120 TaxID=1120995 RepID=A0A1M5SUR5_9FIRM|nr:gamma-glutamyl-gamma-aminobutyrate hydrolase family protein [Anaerosphaera aminiphila]SHH41733.1 putative glutamine amidotransferase [Anaerosphaera aminiphila DSM 21120]
MKPLIAITPRVDTFWEDINMNSDFFNFLEELGATPIILSYNYDEESIDTVLNKIDGIVFTGGHDINPIYYGEFPNKKCFSLSPKRDVFEFDILKKALDGDIPILAICRGMQMLNIVKGGSLYQDLETEYENPLDHTQGEPFSNTFHKVEIIKDNFYGKLFKDTSIEVNSLHHQAVKKLGDDLKVFSKSSDGIVEGIYLEDKKFVCGVQWHPEYLYKKSEIQRDFLTEFINSCK